ncbi:MAG: peptidoglycan-binding protein [Hyphomicrobiales bacterium]|nr:MAG: peptidoglycan-binding protein [Hyphomicrobiales bacterium]
MFDENLSSTIEKIASELNIEPAALKAVVQVESAGRLSVNIAGRAEPLIRFEGHYFYKLLPLAKRNIAVAQGLASAKAGTIKNPLTQKGRWRLLRRAMEINRAAALESVSWGLGQVMGSHWRWLGYASIDALVVEAREGTAGQIRLMARYIEKANLAEKLRAHDWAGFARAYSGPAYRKYKYHTKLKNSYGNFSASGSHKPLKNKMSMLQYGSAGKVVSELQKNLTSLGYFLIADGDFGPATERAVRQFQVEHHLVVDEIFGPKGIRAMMQLLPSCHK